MNDVGTGTRAIMKGATVTRADLCESVHEQVGLTRQDCSELVERVLELMCVALEKGQQVKLSGFGVFQVRAKRARMGRNPKTGEPAAIDPRRVIGFQVQSGSDSTARCLSPSSASAVSGPTANSNVAIGNIEA